ncbi:MAG: sulfurtransferase complex subunit TusB [Hyphomicrobiaceae bacterium]|nr:sulfurtransferase complex subunit TusB [Hyphomicrobiaceae bacterium]
MTTLHIVNKSPFEKNAMESCLGHALDGDAILLFEDGVYGALSNTRIANEISRRAGAVKFFVLGPDLNARGLGDGRIADGITVVDYSGFVDLVTTHGRTQSWL